MPGSLHSAPHTATQHPLQTAAGTEARSPTSDCASRCPCMQGKDHSAGLQALEGRRLQPPPRRALHPHLPPPGAALPGLLLQAVGSPGAGDSREAHPRKDLGRPGADAHPEARRHLRSQLGNVRACHRHRHHRSQCLQEFPATRTAKALPQIDDPMGISPHGGIVGNSLSLRLKDDSAHQLPAKFWESQ